MPGHALTKSTTMMCPHGGSVSATPSNNRAKSGAEILTRADTCTISGCAFTLPNGQPSPCLSVKWLVADTRVSAGSPTLSESSTGLCLSGANVPQGPVSITVTQQKVTTT